MIKKVLFTLLSLILAYTGLTLYMWWTGYVNTIAPTIALDFYQAYGFGWHYAIPSTVLNATAIAFGGAVAFTMILVMVFGTSRLTGQYGTSKWATYRDIKKMHKKIKVLSNTGIILGLFKGKFIRTEEPLSVLVLAPPGTGKTVGIAIPNLLSCNNSMIINDVKNELWELTSGYRAKCQKVLRFAPADADGITCQWNPLDKANMPANWNQKLVLIDRLSNILYPTENNKDSHWAKNAQAVFKLFAMYEIHSKGSTSFGAIRSLVLGSDDMQAQAETISREPSLPIQIIEQCNAFMQKKDAELASIISTFLTGLEVFADPMVALATSGNDFTAHSLRNEKTSVYLCTKVEDMERLAPVMRMILECTMNDLLSQTNPSKDKQITFLIDEFARMGKMDAVLKSPELSRGQKVHTIFIAQDYGQIKEKYGADGVSQLETTTAFKIVFTQNNKDTQRSISDMIGKTTKMRKSINKDKGGKSSGESHSLESVPLITPEEIGSIDNSTALIIAQGYTNRPIKAKICKWFENKEMLKAVKYGQADVKPLEITTQDTVSPSPSQNGPGEMAQAQNASLPPVEKKEETISEDLEMQDLADLDDFIAELGEDNE